MTVTRSASPDVAWYLARLAAWATFGRRVGQLQWQPHASDPCQPVLAMSVISATSVGPTGLYSSIKEFKYWVAESGSALQGADRMCARWRQSGLSAYGRRYYVKMKLVDRFVRHTHLFLRLRHLKRKRARDLIATSVLWIHLERARQFRVKPKECNAVN